jgi:ABC-type branched-subunit amino acid transport system substrate-binding protein
MKTKCLKRFLGLGGAIMVLWACAPGPAVVTQRTPVYPGQDTVLEADGLLETGDYEKAIEYYRRYLDQYPDGPATPVVRLKVGTALNALGRYEPARTSFERLLADYPRSQYASDARLGLLLAYYGDAFYDEAIRLGALMLEEPLSESQRARAHEILGDTFMVLESPEDATLFYLRAYQSAGALQPAVIEQKLKAAIQLLSTSDIAAMLGFMRDDLPRSYLMYQLGVNLAAEGSVDQAAQALDDFLAAYPAHPDSQEARRLLEELSDRTNYNRTTIGCLLPLSGRYQTYGDKALKGVEIALAHFNRQALGDAPIELIVKDSGSDPGQLTAAMEDLVQARVAAIIGPLVDADYAAEMAQKNGIPIVTFTQKEDITTIGDWVFRNFLTPRMQVERIVAYAADVLGVSTYVILYPEEKYGVTFMNLFWDAVIARGGSIVGVESYEPTQTDFAEPIKRLVSYQYKSVGNGEDVIPGANQTATDSNGGQIETRGGRGRREDEVPEVIVDFEAVFIPDAPAKAGLIVPQLAYHDIENVYLLGTNLWHSPKLIEMARDYVQGAIMVDGFFPESKNPRVIEFVGLFNEAYGEMPGIIEATSFDTAMMLFQICQHPDVQSRAAIKEKLLWLRNFPGVTGLTSFDGQREAQKEIKVLRVDGDGFVELD